MGESHASGTPQVRAPFLKRATIAATLLLVPLTGLGLWLRNDALKGRELQTAHRALADGKLDEASKALERALRDSPESAEAHYLKARIAWARNDLSVTDQELGRARALGYTLQPLVRLRGLLLARTNRMDEAEPLLRQAFDGSPEPDPEVAEALARIYLGTFRLSETAAVIAKWTRGSPDDARPYLMQTEIDRRNDAASDVIIAHYRAALDRDPHLDQARFGLAEQFRLKHLYAEAAKEYSAYLSRKPGDPLGYASAAQNALEMGDLADAARLLDQGLALAPQSPEVLAARATLELRRGHLDMALDFFQKAVEADPFDHWNRYQRVLILARLGKKAEAEAEHRVVEQLKNEQEHFGTIRRALLANPLDATLRSEAARWLMGHGHEDEAVDWANLVLRTDPSHPAMNRLLADFYRKKGRTGLANLHEATAAQRAESANSDR